MGANRIRRGASMAERFAAWTHVDANGCWIWEGGRDRDGYGWTTVDRKKTRAHRVSYAAFVAPIPEGMTVDHLCFVPACVNPDHLRLLSVSENSSNQRPFIRRLCKRGLHSFTPDNTRFVTVRGRVERRCRTCAADRTSDSANSTP